MDVFIQLFSEHTVLAAYDPKISVPRVTNTEAKLSFIVALWLSVADDDDDDDDDDSNNKIDETTQKYTHAYQQLNDTI